MRFRLPAFAAVRYVKTRTAVLRASAHGAPSRSLGPLDLTKILDSVRFAGPVLTSVLLASSLACAQNGAPAPRPEEDFSFMKMLADKGLHDIENESWNAYGQFTYISSWKPSFYAPYTNLNGSINSLLPTAERSFTGTATLYLGVRLWKGAEACLVPELISEQPFHSSGDWAALSRISSCKKAERGRRRHRRQSRMDLRYPREIPRDGWHRWLCW